MLVWCLSAYLIYLSGNQDNIQQMYSVVHHLWHISTPICFNTEVPFSGSHCSNSDVLLTVHRSIFISVFNQLDAQNLFRNKYYFMHLHDSSACAYHQEVKIALHTLWYHHTYRCDDTRGCVMQFWTPDDEHTYSKHVDARNKTYCETNFKHQVG